MSRHSEGMPGQYQEEETEILLESSGYFGKRKQPESRTETSAVKSNNKELDFSHHPFLTGKSDEDLPTSLKIEDVREFKRIIRDTTEGEKWYRFLLAIAEYDNDLFAQSYVHQKKAVEHRKQAKEFATRLQNTEENWIHDKLGLEEARAHIQELQNQLDDSLRRQREVTAASTVSESIVTNYRPIGINPSEPLKETDANEYNTWAYAIREKLETDKPLYPTDKRKVRYVLSQMKDPIFDAMHSWVFDIGNDLTLDLFFKEIENYMGIHHQKKNAKKELLTIKMNKTESVSEYYHRLFKLWQRAGTSLEDRIDQFIGSVTPGISNALQAREYKDFTKLLEDARRVEGYRKDMFNNFYSNKEKPEKTNKFSMPVRGFQKTISPIITTTEKSSTSAAKTPHPNEKFRPVNKRPEGWTGLWFDSESNPGKLTDADRERLAKQGRCWSCRRSGHRGHDICCPNAGRKSGARVNKNSGRKTEGSGSEYMSDSEKE